MSKLILNDLTRKNIKCKVKSIKETEFFAKEKFGKITKGETLSCNNDVTFNIMGNLVEENSYFKDGTLRDKHTFKYNGKGQMIEDRYSIGKFIYEYKNKGRLVEASVYDLEGAYIGKYIYKYNDNGWLLEENNDYIDISLATRKTYKYNRKGEKIEEYCYSDVLENKWTYEYNDSGLLIEEDQYCGEDSMHCGNITYKYNDNRDKVEINSYNEDDFLLQKRTYKYTYDKFNNWVKRIEYINDEPSVINEREITYKTSGKLDYLQKIKKWFCVK